MLTLAKLARSPQVRPLLLLAALLVTSPAGAQEEFIPRRQDKLPGPPLTPAQAQAKMTVPEGFSVELVASEPDVVNPVAMTFDEQGRVWITESFEYPRREPGPGRDRIKVLEDTDGDGQLDKVTIFAEGLNIPSGIAVGHGGVWVANAPDLLFMQDTDGDLKADKQEVIVTGFGRQDTHELPNSLTWGPDGWLYGLNGVFNPGHIEYRGKTYDFTCALFRIHPRTRDFELFCEGTSNPWGVAFDREGSAFVSACVIDHLWHLTESGYYHRQGGPYPPYTWKLESIVNHQHQLAAYCGLTYFDSDAYPEEYRQVLYMGNIHGNCVNADRLHRRGATYHATPEEDFLTANDVWFMPVVQKTGPDGCLYVLDWYDRYHCYQDANRDPAGIDRLHGRLWRVRYQNTPRARPFNLAEETSAQLVERLDSPNIFYRELAQRLLQERQDADVTPKLQEIVLAEGTSDRQRMHALWSLIGTDSLEESFHLALLNSNRAELRAWGVRAAGNFGQVSQPVTERIADLAADPEPSVRLQVAIAARKVKGLDPLSVLADVLVNYDKDSLLPNIVWQNVHPLLGTQGEDFLRMVNDRAHERLPVLRDMTPFLVERLLSGQGNDFSGIAALLEVFLSGPQQDAASAKACLAAIAQKIQTREIQEQRLDTLRKKLAPAIAKIHEAGSKHPLYLDSVLLAVSWDDKQSLAAVRRLFADKSQAVALRRQALDALVAAGDPELMPTVAAVLADGKQSPEVLGDVLASLARRSDDQVASVVLAAYEQLDASLKPRAIELLAQRPAWARQLLLAISEKQLPATVLNVNQVRRLLASPDKELAASVQKHWGTIRTERSPQRETVIADMRLLLRHTQGDPQRGLKAYDKLCGQCHQLFGRGQQVGPDITKNGRSNFEQLLSNVFDPSLVIGTSYQAYTVATDEGRILTGLLVEDSPQRIVLKMQGGKQEVVPRDEIDIMEKSKLSMMPEGVEKQLQPQEIADLFALLALDRLPTEKGAEQMFDLHAWQPEQTSDAAQFGRLVSQVAPGFTTAASGEGGVALLKHQGRDAVLRTHPVARGQACVLAGTVEVPLQQPRLELEVSPDARGDWQLAVEVDGKRVHTSPVSQQTADKDGWKQVTVDLTPWAGRQVPVKLENQPSGWSYEFGYWGRVRVVGEAPAAQAATTGGS